MSKTCLGIAIGEGRVSQMPDSLRDRFWTKVDKTGDCWLWQAAKDPYGYGRFWVGRNRWEAAHRMAYTLVVGVIPDEMVVDHMCHNPACVKPCHLRLVTHQENMQNRSGARENSKSGIRGVSWNRSKGKWEVRVQHGVDIYYKTFATIKEAEAAAVAKRLEWHTHNDVDRVS